MTFDTTYTDVPDEQRQQLRSFRDNHPVRTAVIHSTPWSYIACGQGDPLLWLVGGLKVADAAFEYIPRLEDDFRIIAPDYPALHSMSDLADGLAGLLDAEGIQQTHIIAGSFGGMLAQEFVRQHPDRVHRIVLSSTTAPDLTEAERYSRQLDMIADADSDDLRDAATMRFYGILNPPPDKDAFYRAYLNELFHQRLDREDIVSTYNALIDFMEKDYSADDLNTWSGKILILDSSDDSTFGEASRQAMYTLYPDAIRYNFTDAGHSPARTHPEEYFDVVRTFLRTGSV